MVLIKVNEVPTTKEGLKDRTRRAWRINPSRLYGQGTLISVYRGKILQVYKILGYGIDKIEHDRVAFELEEIESDLIGRRIDTKTSNPCTIIDDLIFEYNGKFLISEVLDINDSLIFELHKLLGNHQYDEVRKILGEKISSDEYLDYLYSLLCKDLSSSTLNS